jgi:uncharacterized repeat protein (TIGR04076 family)
MDSSKYNGKCAQCDRVYIIGQRLYFIKGEKAYFETEECMRAWAKAHQIVVDTQEGTKTGQTTSPPTNVPGTVGPPLNAAQMPLCMVCGGKEYPVRTYIAKDEVEWDICTFCTRLAKAQRNLKILGLWKPVKREDVVP